MPDLAVIETDHYDCVIWAGDVAGSQQRLAATMKGRGREVPLSTIRFIPPLSFDSGAVTPSPEVCLDEAVFFENKLYDIEFVFKPEIVDGFDKHLPRIEHKLSSVEDAFHYSRRSHSLRGSINTSNDIGWFWLNLVYCYQGRIIEQSFGFEILPTKMDVASDFREMNRAIEDTFPLWRYSLAEKTSHQLAAVKQPHSQFLLLWFAQFEALNDAMFTGLKHIVNAPHSRLVGHRNAVKMGRLKGKLSPKLEESVVREKKNRNYDKRFIQNKKTLDVDTPENRFIKAVVNHSIEKLTKIQQETSGRARLSGSFSDKLGHWQTSLRYFQRQPFFREIGKYTGLKKESLVLQQKPGYSKVYKIWQQLKWYLELLDGDSNLSLRNVAEMYEIWCFLEIRRILLELKFEEVAPKRIPLVNNGIEVSMKDGMAGSFHFERQDGVKIRLAHEPAFRKNGGPIKTWLVTQKPDILLEVSLVDGVKLIWLFDAKYRIKTARSEWDVADMVPDDAIHQMHRYRDALVHHSKFDDIGVNKSRPVFGAYALYPGYYDQQPDSNPYADAINEIGIGAFALLPDVRHKGSLWLKAFLKKQLGDGQSCALDSDWHFVEEASRIPSRGNSVAHYRGLTILASQLGPNRNQDYVEQFERGEAHFYHTRLFAFERQKIQQHIAMEAGYLAVAVDRGDGETRAVEYIYPIIKAERIKRKNLTEDQTGTVCVSDPEERFWFFSLGKALQLKNALIQKRKQHFEIKLVAREDLSGGYDWDELPELYTSLARKSG
ncbi:hypothetical protein ACH42_14625 [Endozoicomonas sp. (ex Bugula neritina AB1)]|nr:hypothetical protein ACH42_14625 [Endozoicomonas sp. (ex Bugula neritina AB1)]